jgi:hypothetical protein
MKNLQIYCLSLSPSHLSSIKKLEYLPVGLGDNSFSDEWLGDKTDRNISSKNSFYGEYTFHYWLWKNKKINFSGWVGFCQYRKFWIKNFNNNRINNFNELNNQALKQIPTEFENFESILGEELFINKIKLSKLLKHNFKTMFLNPNLFLDKNKRTVKFHFDMMHGKGNLDKAIQLLPDKDKEDFKEFVNTEVSFNPHNMFICKNKNILFNYYESLFPWLNECEKIFGFKNLNNYGLKRIYAFLAERYMSFWFKKYTKFKILPIHFKDLNDFF